MSVTEDLPISFWANIDVSAEANFVKAADLIDVFGFPRYSSPADRNCSAFCVALVLADVVRES